MTQLTAGGHLVLCLADRDPETADGISIQEERRDGTRLSIRLDLETFFVVNPAAWRDTDEGEQLLVYVPGPLGADISLRAPKRLFREVHTPSRKDTNVRT